MSINTKYSDFLRGELALGRSLGPKDYAEEGIRGTIGLRDTLFECGVSVDSPFIAPGQSSFFGAYSYMNGGGYIRGRCFVGRYCSIGRRVTIGAGRHGIAGLSSSPALSAGPAEQNYTPDEMQKIGVAASVSGQVVAPTYLGCDVWIGDGAVIMPGLSIGHGAVIGANAVITRNVAPYAIVAGLPGRVIRDRFATPQIEALLASRWWDHSRATLSALPLGNILKALDALARIPLPEDAYETFSLSSSADLGV